jgi:hypothetical protein
MLHLPRPRAALHALLALPLAAAPAVAGRAPAAAAGPGGSGAARAAQASATSSPARAATAYLRLRARCPLEPAAGRALAARCLPGAPHAARERLLASGERRLATQLGHRTTGVSCRVVVRHVRLSADAATATVAARVVTIVTWVAADGRTDTEGDGIDHTVVLVRRNGGWLVAADRYTSDLTPRLLQAAGAPQAVVDAAAGRLETAGVVTAPRVGPTTPAAAVPANATPTTPAGAAPGYVAQLSFDRTAAKAYADRCALSYNPTYASFSADCANFGSQVMFAGGYPQFGDTYASGWWYDKHGTSSPADDTYSHAWIAVANQQGAWHARYADLVSSISDVGTGDFIAYDWTGNGTWDHVAELVGTNSAGQKVVDAHTTDHYHVYWKLGTATTHYRFMHTRATIVI